LRQDCAVASFGIFSQCRGLLAFPIAAGMLAHGRTLALISVAGEVLPMGPLVACILVSGPRDAGRRSPLLPFAAVAFSAVVSLDAGFISV